MRFKPTCVLTCGIWLVATSPATAQHTTPLHHGTFVIAGTAGINHGPDIGNGLSWTMYRLQPTVLFFVTSRLALGGALAVTHYSDSTFAQTTLGLGPSARYYLGRKTSRLLPSLASSLFVEWGWGHTRAVPAVFAFDRRDTAVTLDMSVGLTVLVSRQIGILGEGYYKTQHFTVAIDGTSSTTRGENDGDDWGLRIGVAGFVF